MPEMNHNWEIVRFPKRNATVIISLISYAAITIYDDEPAAYLAVDHNDKTCVEKFNNVNVALALLQKIDEIERKKEQ